MLSREKKNFRSAGTIINSEFIIGFIRVTGSGSGAETDCFSFYVVSIIALIHDFDNDLIKMGISPKGECGHVPRQKSVLIK